MNSDQIRPEQFARLAYVYIRQSSMHQVYHHTESQHRQRQLVERAGDEGQLHPFALLSPLWVYSATA